MSISNKHAHTCMHTPEYRIEANSTEYNNGLQSHKCSSLVFPSELYRCDIQDTSDQCDITGGFEIFASCDLEVTYILGEDIDWDDVGEEDEDEYKITYIRLCPQKMDAGTSTYDDIDHPGYLWHALETAPLNWVRVSTN